MPQVELYNPNAPVEDFYSKTESDNRFVIGANVSNALTYNSSDDTLKFGGALTQNTNVTGSYSLTFGTDLSTLTNFNVRSSAQNTFKSGTNNWIAAPFTLVTDDLDTFYNTASVLLELRSTTRFLKLTNQTTGQRDAINVSNTSSGGFIFNFTTKLLNFHDGTTWQEVPTLAYVNNSFLTQTFADNRYVLQSNYTNYFRGTYTSLANLQAAWPTTIAGSYAIVDTGGGNPAKQYVFDVEDGWTLVTGNATIYTNGDGLNLTGNVFSVDSTVLRTTLTSGKFLLGNASNLANSVYLSKDGTLDNIGQLTINWTNSYPTLDTRYVQISSTTLGATVKEILVTSNGTDTNLAMPHGLNNIYHSTTILDVATNTLIQPDINPGLTIDYFPRPFAAVNGYTYKVTVIGIQKSGGGGPTGIGSMGIGSTFIVG